MLRPRSSTSSANRIIAAPKATLNHLRNVQALSLHAPASLPTISIARSMLMYQSVTAIGISMNGARQRYSSRLPAASVASSSVSQRQSMIA